MFFKCVNQLSFVCSYKPILEYIDAQFEKYLEEELKIKRSLLNYHDTRIHICLYFIAPNGHSLKSLDLVMMKKLDSKVTNESCAVYFKTSCYTFFSLSLTMFIRAGEHHPGHC